MEEGSHRATVRIPVADECARDAVNQMVTREDIVRMEGERNVLGLLGVIRSHPENSPEASSALVALHRICDGRDVDILIWELSDGSELVRRTAARIIGDVGGGRAVGPLVENLQDERWETRQGAVLALGAIGGAKAVEPVLLTLRNDDDPRVRAAAAAGLGDIGTDEVLPHLLDALMDDAPEVRLAAVRSLGRTGSGSVVEPLIEVYGDGERAVRLEVVRALSAIGDDPALGFLRKMARGEDEYPDVRWAAEASLERKGQGISGPEEGSKERDRGSDAGAEDMEWEDGGPDGDAPPGAGDAKQAPPATPMTTLDIDWDDDEVPEEERTTIDAIFLLGPDQILMNQYIRSKDSDLDPDILASMLVAVQTFVKDAFNTMGTLNQLRLSDMTVILSKGELITIAAVVRGPDAGAFAKQVDAAVMDIEGAHHEYLKGWDGNTDSTRRLDEHMKRLVLGDYG